jgi:hypothetical protein
VDEKFGGDDHGGEETGGGVEEAEAGLFADVGDVAEIPGDEIIDLMKRGEGDVDGVGDVFSVKDPAFDIAFGENGDFFGELELLERLDQIQISGTVRLGDALKLTPDKYRAKSAVFGKFVFPPPNSHIPPERFAIIQVRADHGGFEI